MTSALGSCFMVNSRLQGVRTLAVCTRCCSARRCSIPERPLTTVQRLVVRNSPTPVASMYNLMGAASRRSHGTSTTDSMLVNSMTLIDCPLELLTLTGRHRSNLNQHHVCHALNHLWGLVKFDNDGLVKTIHKHPEFDALCVLAENKVKEIDGCLLVDTLYAALRLTPDIYHPLVRSLRTEIHHRLGELQPNSLSKLAVCLHDMKDNRSPLCGAVLRHFLAILHEVDSVREVSAWMREVIHLASARSRDVIYRKVSQLLTEANADDIGDNSIRRIIQSMTKVRATNMQVLNQCAQLLLNIVDNVNVNELCMINSMLTFLNYENKALYGAFKHSIIKRLPECRDPTELALVVECIGATATADVKLLLLDKAEEVIPDLSPVSLGHMCAGLRQMGYRSQSALMRKLLCRIRDDSHVFTAETIVSVVEFLSRVVTVEPDVYEALRERLAELLRVSLSPGRVLSLLYSLSYLPGVDSFDYAIVKRTRAMMPQMYIPGNNQLLMAISKIVHKMDTTTRLGKEFLNLKQELFFRAQTSIDKITSVHFLNNIIDIILQDGGHVLVLDAAMKQYHAVLHRLNPQQAVDCARNLSKSRYLQRELLDQIAKVTTEKMYKITPMQILYLLSPFCMLNYQPPNSQEFFQACLTRLEPFLDSLPSGYLVDLTHIMTFVQQFPEVLIRRIFSLDFLTALDEELETIPERSLMYRRKLMYLNRTVALECPELQVPWFHEQFSQDLLKKRSLTFDSSLRSVQTALVEVLGGAQYFRSFIVSPYYYEISFECVLDSKGNPLSCADYGSVLNRSGDKMTGTMLADLMQWGTQTKHLPPGAQRVAIDYLPSSLFCINSRHALGMVALKQRHMELMGYRYVQIPHFCWSSAALSEPEEKIEYLRQIIFSHNQPDANLARHHLNEEHPLLTERLRPKLPANLGINKEGLLEDEMVLKVLHTFDKMG